ncbi:DUF1285 domain-containing protein [Cognatishimia maritima]|uniref:Proteophosphoglycan n=1 Tax=Cognatishimia maritima TaxID=870908 RepID=A0A1M5NR15_9RHOB|nr:DUF1285 domain-containing protein [Cognatishimia maritima]SHG91960.1 hypothetical protein SAMN04488044_1608 [Cognatishimia maritima]
MSTQNVVKSSPKGLNAAVEQSKGRKLPPVHLWNPPYCGDLDIQIKRDGTWIHEGGKINRSEMVRLFSSILRKEGDSYFLVTPVEKVGITVEDVPFVATDMTVSGTGSKQTLTFETHVGDSVVVDADHPIRVALDKDGETPLPYVMVRSNLEARIDRKTFYRLVEQGHEVDGWFGVTSSGVFFPLIKADQLEA